jgi:hypothetical protein
MFNRECLQIIQNRVEYFWLILCSFR